MTERTIVIATDGSPASTAAVEAGLELASRLASPVRLVHAASPLADELYADHPEQGPSSDEIVERDPVLADAVARAEAAGVEAEPELIAGAPSAELAASVAGIAEGLGAGLIVVGSRGRGPVAGAVLGSVSQSLIKFDTVPVLVVHAPPSD